MLKWIELSKLHDDTRNANVCEPTILEKIKRHIQRTKLCPPLIIRRHPSQADNFILIDGHHRKTILNELGWEKAPCLVWDISDQEAQLALATLNRLRGTDLPRKRAELLHDLTQHFSLPQLSELLPETSSEIADLLELLKLDTEQLEKALKAQMAQEQALLPIALSFLVAPEEAKLIEKVLAQVDRQDRGKALVKICQQYEGFCHDAA